jgi:hypothetical protein
METGRRKGMRLVQQPGWLSENRRFTGREIAVFLVIFVQKLNFLGNAIIFKRKISLFPGRFLFTGI